MTNQVFWSRGLSLVLCYSFGRILFGVAIALNTPLNLVDSYCYIRMDKHNTGLGAHIGLWLWRISANLEARGNR